MNPSPSPSQGVGYYAGCDVLLDRNGNGRADEGEPVTTTATAASGQPGSFELEIPKTARLPLLAGGLARTLTLSLSLSLTNPSF